MSNDLSPLHTAKEKFGKVFYSFVEIRKEMYFVVGCVAFHFGME